MATCSQRVRFDHKSIRPAQMRSSGLSVAMELETAGGADALS
jgi:hypothetical protein